MDAPALATNVLGLPALEARLRQDLAYLELPGRQWVPAQSVGGASVAPVVVIGAGMCGLTVAAALGLMGIGPLRVLDRAPAGQEGPWVTFARMETLRSPKGLAGPALGLPSLTFRAWFEAQFGAAAWEGLGKIPRTQWMDYLVWYRRVMGVPVENGVTVGLIRPREDGLIAVESSAGEILARHVVLATGRDGLGGAWTPPMADAIDRKLWAHSRDAIDFAALAGKRVGVVGAGASAMDNAATALEAGAGRLDLFVRRAKLPPINKMTGVGSPGLVEGFEALPDAWKWRMLHYALSEQTPPPRDSTLRVARHPHAHLHLSSPILDLRQQGDTVALTTREGTFTLDYVIFATGFRVDLTARPELALLAPHIRFWRDRFTPDSAESDDGELAWSPDLDPAFAFQEREAGSCPALSHVHSFNYPSSLSHGRLSGDIPAVSDGARRLARAIARSLFTADAPLHYAMLQAFDAPELQGDEWTRPPAGPDGVSAPVPGAASLTPLPQSG